MSSQEELPASNCTRTIIFVKIDLNSFPTERSLCNRLLLLCYFLDVFIVQTYNIMKRFSPKTNFHDAVILKSMILHSGHEIVTVSCEHESHTDEQLLTW